MLNGEVFDANTVILNHAMSEQYEIATKSGCLIARDVIQAIIIRNQHCNSELLTTGCSFQYSGTTSRTPRVISVDGILSHTNTM